LPSPDDVRARRSAQRAIVQLTRSRVGVSLIAPDVRISMSARAARAGAQELPRLAVLLGGGGLLPFVWFATQHDTLSPRHASRPWGDAVLASLEARSGLPLGALRSGDQATVRARFLSYSAVILSFVGAVHWGAALSVPTAFAPAQLAFGVLPSLAGWVALAGNKDTVTAHYGLAAAHLATYFFDEFAAAAKPVPAVPLSYMSLRAPLTSVVVGLHCIAAYGARERSVTDGLR
jgi:hypothetical protein